MGHAMGTPWGCVTNGVCHGVSRDVPLGKNCAMRYRVV